MITLLYVREACSESHLDILNPRLHVNVLSEISSPSTLTGIMTIMLHMYTINLSVTVTVDCLLQFGVWSMDVHCYTLHSQTRHSASEQSHYIALTLSHK